MYSCTCTYIYTNIHKYTHKIPSRRHEPHVTLYIHTHIHKGIHTYMNTYIHNCSLQVRANSMALRERDAAEVRAQIEQQSMAKLQVEMTRTSNELGQMRDKMAEKAKRIDAVRD